MGRPKEHGDETRVALLAAAERIVAEGGPDALSIRTVADAAGTTTRAVYSLFGSKDGLLVALAARAIDLLDAGLARQRETGDPARDLVELGTRMYRSFVGEHPSPYRLAFQRIVPELPLGPSFFEAREKTFSRLEAKVQRLADAGLLRSRSVREAAVEFNAMCEGLANAELRGGTMTPGDQEQVWRDAFTTLVNGFAAGEPKPARAPERSSRASSRKLVERPPRSIQ